MKPLKIVETSLSPAGVDCGMSRPPRARLIFVLGESANGASDPAGPMLVAPKKFWKPICESATPTDDGFVSEVASESEIPPAGSLAGRSNPSTTTSPLKPFIPSRTT